MRFTMNKTSSLILLSLCGVGPVFGNSPKPQALDFGYTFSKVYIYNESKNVVIITKTESENYFDTYIYPEYTWGKQGMVGYEKKLKNSDYKFLTHFTGLHASYHFYKFLPAGSDLTIYTPEDISIGSQYADAYYDRKQIFNYFGLDLLVEASLKKTKHAEFYTQGGAVFGWMQRHYVSKFQDTPDLSSVIVNGYYSTKRKDFFLGPNLKIGVKAPFCKNYLRANLLAGAGLLIDFSSLKNHTPDSGLTGYIRQYVTSTTDVVSSSNRYRFSPQLDLEASISFDYHDVHITSGLNQFVLMYNFTSGSFSSVIFGGPFIKASFDF
jgi:hypothetical protein